MGTAAERGKADNLLYILCLRAIGAGKSGVEYEALALQGRMVSRMPVIITLADGSGEIAVVAVSNSESRVPHVETASDAGLTTQGLLAAITEFVCSAARGPALATTIEIEADDRLRAPREERRPVVGRRLLTIQPELDQRSDC